MLAESQKLYPGELATPGEIRLLADEYRKAAHHLQQLGRAGEPLSRAPFRLSAIHAIELYLNALLLHRGYAPSEIRRMQHDLAERTGLAIASGLRLRTRTVAHLNALAENREYLMTRYGPELSGTASQINRLEATLEEVARKVTEMLIGQRASSLAHTGQTVSGIAGPNTNHLSWPDFADARRSSNVPKTPNPQLSRSLESDPRSED